VLIETFKLGEVKFIKELVVALSAMSMVGLIGKI
jgi:hypothetical protein